MRLCLSLCLAAAAVVATASVAAHADAISFAGSNTYCVTAGNGCSAAGDVTFYAPTYVGYNSATGIFAPFQAGTVKFNNFNTVNDKQFSLLDISAGASSLNFFVTDYTTVIDNNAATCSAGNCTTISGIGYYTLNNGGANSVTNGVFTLTTQGGGTANAYTTFSDTNLTAATPEPSSLLLLGTGLMGGAGVLVRRRRLA